MNKVTVNEKYLFVIDAENDLLKVNGNELVVDVFTIEEGKKHILHDNKSYNFELVSLERESKMLKVKVNGNVYDVQITTPLDVLLKKLGMDSGSASKIQQVKAPMPGLVLSVLVEEGQQVKKGDNLVILEAMKMENIIKSPVDGTIDKVGVKEGNKIEKNTVIIKYL